MPTYDLVDIDQINFGIVLDNFSHTVNENDIGDGWRIGSASKDEKLEISKHLRNLYTINHVNRPPQEGISNKTKHGWSTKFYSDPDIWRYHVVRPTVGQSKLRGAQLSEALLISEADILVELWSIARKQETPKMAIGGNLGSCLPRIRRASHPLNADRPSIDTENIKEIVNLRADLDSKQFAEIAIALDRFRKLETSPRNDLKMLGYFGVMEALLSHAPKPNDSADSITRQLKRNLLLLNNRMPTEANLELTVDNGPNADKVISKLYEYRSAVAHGGNQDSARAWLYENLVTNKKPNHDNSNEQRKWLYSFLRKIVRRTLRQTLLEPQLVKDLK